MTAHGFAIGDDVPIVLFDGPRETVMPLGVGYEVVVVGSGGVHRSFKGAASGIADRAGRESGVAVGVVWRREAHVGVVERSLVCSSQQFRVDDTGIGVKRDAFVQAVEVDAGDLRAFGGDGRFLFDDGGHSYELMQWTRWISSFRHT